MSTLTTNKGGSTGAITYTCSDETNVGIEGSEFYTEIPGTYSITATMAADATYCEAQATFTITVQAAPCTPLTTPTGLNASATTDSTATLTWGNVTNAIKYQVTLTPAGGTAKTDEATGTTYNATGLSPETTYTWTVKAIGDGTTYCDSEESTSGTFTTLAKPKYTITWSKPDGTTTTQVTQGEKIGTLPADPEAPQGCTDNKVFVGWSTTNIGTGGQDNAPDFITAETAPTGDVTYYAIFATETTTGGGSSGAAVGTILWVENFAHFGTKTPSAAGTGSGTTIYGGATITYTQSSTSTKGYNEKLAGGTAPELLLAKSNETWTIDGIKTGSATEMSLTLVSNKTSGITLSSETSGITVSGDFGAWTIKNNGTSETFNLTFKNTTTGNIRIDNIELSITAAAGGGSTTTYTGYVTGCEACTAPSTPLSITAAETVLNLGADGTASTTFSTAGGNTGPITYTVTPSTGSVSDNTVTFTAAGVYTLKATQDKTDGYCVQNVTVQIEVKATPVVTIVAADPLEIKAKCGATATAEVQVTAYNCGTTAVTIASSNGNIKVDPATFTPDADGKVNGTVTVSYTASTGGTQESHTATLSAKCGTVAGQNTLTVNAVKDGCTPATILFYDRGAQYKSFTNKYAGDKITAAEVPDPTGVCTVPVAYVFDGWAEQTVTAGTTSYNKVKFPYTITGEKTLYAVYRYEDGNSGSAGGSKVGLSDLKDGGKYFITATNNGTEYMLKATQFSAGGGSAAAFDSSTAVESDAWTFTKQGGANTWYIKDAAGNYLYCTNANNGLACGSTEDYYTISTSSGTLVYLKDKNQTRYVSLVVGSGNWRCYGNTSNGVPSIQLYSAPSYLYTTSPVCGPYLQLKGAKKLYVTGGNAGGTARKTVVAQDSIPFVAGTLQPHAAGTAPKVYVNSTANQIHNVGDHSTPNKNFTAAVTQTVTMAADGTYTIEGYIKVTYKPDANGVTEDVCIVPRVTYNTTATLDSFTVHARALPDRFVIAAKSGGKWYALPADMYPAGTYAGNGQLTVDNPDNPTVASFAPDNSIYTFEGNAQGGDLRYVRFAGIGGKCLWASSSDTKIKNDAASPAADNDNYNWLLATTDHVSYTFGNKVSASNLRCGSGNKFGMYTSGTGDLRILPIADSCAYSPKPEYLRAVERKSTQATFAWNAVEGAEAYQYSLDGGEWTPIAGIDLADPGFTVTGLGVATNHTFAVRAKHGTLPVCADTAMIAFTTANCDNLVTIAASGSVTDNCGTISLTGLSIAIDATGTCPATKWGVEYSLTPDFAKPVRKNLTVTSGNVPDFATVNEPGTYYFRIYAENEVGTAYSAQFATCNVAGVAGLKIMFENNDNTAPLVGGKASKRLVYYSESSGAVTWTVSHPSDAAGDPKGRVDDADGYFYGTAMGVYTVTVSQEPKDGYCAATATAYIEVRNPCYHSFVTNCAELNNGNIEVIDQDVDHMDVVVDDADMVKLTIVRDNTGNNTGQTGGQLFFSKYFEANGNAKILAIYNGTAEKISLANVAIYKGGADVKLALSPYGHKETGWIYPGEEIILYNMGTPAVNACMEQEATYPDWYNANSHAALQFGGKNTIALVDNGTIIDIIGAFSSSAVTNISSAQFASGTVKPSWGDDSGFTCAGGDNIKTKDVTETDYGLSTNRCLLIRLNTVKDGLDAVARNVNGLFNTLCEEWGGFHIDKANSVDKGQTESCEGMAYVGAFDYNEYFDRYEPISDTLKITAEGVRQPDGTFRISAGDIKMEGFKDFRDLACSSIKIQGFKQGETQPSTTLDYKVPIIVKADAQTDDAALFDIGGQGRTICPDCDVVIRDAAKLQVVKGGYNQLRDVYVYPTGRLQIEDGRAYNARRVYVSSDLNTVGYALVEGTLSAILGVGHYKRIDALAWYDFSLPYDCKVSDIARSNGKTLGEYGTDWFIKYYDGQKRANTGTPNGAAPTNWEHVPATGTLKAGVGYIIGLGGLHEVAPNLPQYKVRISLPNVSGQVYTETNTSNQTRPVTGYTGPKAEELPCHRGWNYIGNPFISLFDGSEQNPEWSTDLLLNGYYTDGLTGQTYDYEKYPDIYVAVDEGTNGLTDWVQTKASAAKLLPFRAFFVQAVSDGYTDFAKQARTLPNMAPARRATERGSEVSAFDLVLTDSKQAQGSARVKMGDGFCKVYEVGHDMVRMINKRQAYPQPYTIDSAGYSMICHAIDRETPVNQTIPVGFYTRTKGTYTFSIDRMEGMGDYAAVYLEDNVEHTVTDLLQGAYTFSAAAGTTDGRFSIYLRENKVPTEMAGHEGQEPVIYRHGDAIVIESLPVGAQVRIVDAVGRVLHRQRADGRPITFSTPVRGAYVIQVTSGNDSYSIKTIL